MKNRTKITEEYRKLGELSRCDMTSEVQAEIKRALKGTSSLLVSRAAEIAGDKELFELIPELAAAFVRMLDSEGSVDKGCRAKTAIVDALNALDYAGDEVFLLGAGYSQMEGSFGPPEDSATAVRSGCAFGLARINHRDAHYVLADLLVDSAATVRIAAVKGLAYMGTPEAEIMLRLKVLCGDKEIDVTGECFLGLMTIAPGRSLDFVSRYLRVHGAGILESSAIAIGSSHLPEALAVLMDLWDEIPLPSVRRALLLPIALIRSDDAFKFLIAALHKSDRKTAGDALEVLVLYTGESYRAKIKEAVLSRSEPEITARFQTEFGL